MCVSASVTRTRSWRARRKPRFSRSALPRFTGSRTTSIARHHRPRAWPRPSCRRSTRRRARGSRGRGSRRSAPRRRTLRSPPPRCRRESTRSRQASRPPAVVSCDVLVEQANRQAAGDPDRGRHDRVEPDERQRESAGRPRCHE